MEVREKKLRNGAIREYLIKWKKFPIEDTTWENKHVLQHTDLELLVGNQFLARETVMSPSK